jgi:hypothetical protein
MSSTKDMTDAELDEAVAAALAELGNQPELGFDEQLVRCGAFVARFGALGDLYDEPDLTWMQSRTFGLPASAAWNLIAHWSVERGDPTPDPSSSFLEGHMRNCRTCDYLEGVRDLVDTFEYALCSECGLDLDAHDIGPDAIGKAHAYCRSVWTRVEPLVGQGGDVAPHQISDAYTARWIAHLTDGTFALVTRAYYIAHNDDDSYVPHPDDQSAYARQVPYVERQDEYLVCRDPADPGGTEINPEYVHTEIESDDPTSEDPRALAAESFEPEDGEWEEHAPEFARDMLTRPGAVS